METITMQRHGQNNWIEKVLDNGQYISMEPYQDKGTIAKIYQRDNVNKIEIFKTREQAKQYLEQECNIKITDEVEAYIVNRSNPNINDIYYAAAIFDEYSQTFRTAKENYCIAGLDAQTGELDFSYRDAAIKHIYIPNIKEVQQHAKWTFNRKDIDNVWTAWLLSQYMKESGKGFQTVKTTVANMNKCSIWKL